MNTYRRRFSVIISVLVLLAISTISFAIDPLEFSSQKEEIRYQTLVRELRCLVCQNQNLADSDAPLARDLRLEIFRMVEAGRTDNEIKQFLTGRYGDFVLYNPPLKAETWALWFGPIILLLIGFMLARRWWRKPLQENNAASKEEDMQSNDGNDGEFS